MYQKAMIYQWLDDIREIGIRQSFINNVGDVYIPDEEDADIQKIRNVLKFIDIN